MVETRKHDTKGDTEAITQPHSLDISKAGIQTGSDFAALMSSLMSDVIEGSISPQVANAVCNAGGKLLKVVEMQYKYANKPTIDSPRTPPILILAPPNTQIDHNQKNKL